MHREDTFAEIHRFIEPFGRAVRMGEVRRPNTLPGGSMIRLSVRSIATAAVAVLALAACGSSSKSTSPTNSSEPSTTAAPTTTAPATTTTVSDAAATVKLATTPLGKVLVDDKGLTLYRFDNDTAPGKSTCGAGICQQTWPPEIVTGTPTAGSGIDAAKLTTFARADGSMQLQIDGHPLYHFVQDTKTGDTKGQGILGKWYAAGPDGGKVGDNS
jgi:predicted lipoprotein with Yx(FWY)xxD motif